MFGYVGAIAPIAVEVTKGAPIKVDSVVTPTTYAVIIAIITGVIGMATLWIKIRPAMQRIKMEGDASLRTQLLERIGNLEKLAGEQSQRHSEIIAKIKYEHSEEIASVRKELREQHRSCEEENRDLRNQITGLQRQMILWQMTTGQAMPLHISPEQQKTIDKILAAMGNPDRLSLIAAALEGGGPNASD